MFYEGLGNMVGDDHELDSKDMVGHRLFLS
jgi:hypothetical protein